MERGETRSEVLVRFPGSQVKVVAPFALSVKLCPRQIAVTELVILTVGSGTTLTVEVAELVHVPLLPTIV